MSRLPVDEQNKLLRGQDLYWRIIRTLGASGGEFTVPDVAGKTNAARDSVREYMTRLEKAGYLVRRGTCGGMVTFAVAKDSRFTPRIRRDGSEVPPSKQDQMWRTMKMLKRFTVHDLSVAASTDTVTVSSVHAEDYVRHLVKAGYVRQLSDDLFALLPSKNTGPRAPYIQRVKHVYDPNLDRVVWRSGHDE